MMPGKKNKTKSPAGNSGLNPETTSQEQNHDQTMDPNAGSVAAVELPRQETQGDESDMSPDSAIKAFDELYDMTDDPAAVDPPPPQTDDLIMGDGIEEEDAFLLPESQSFVPGTAEDFTEKMRQVQRPEMEARVEEEGEERPYSQTIPPMGK